MTLAVLIRLYQRWLTRYTPRCPNAPSCSAYGLRTARLHGSLRGGLIAYRRVQSCGAIAYAMRHAEIDCTPGPWRGSIWEPQRREGCLPASITGPCDDFPSGPNDGCLE